MNLITRARAQRSIAQSSFTAAEHTLTDEKIAAASAAIVSYCGRGFHAQRYDRLYNGLGTHKLMLDDWPIIDVERVAADPTAVLKIKNTATTNQRATVRVDQSGIILGRVAAGVTAAPNRSVAFATYVTITAVNDAINALGNGWSSSIPDSDYSNWPSADLRSLQGALSAADSREAKLYLHVDEDIEYDIDENRGYLIAGRNESRWDDDGRPTATWLCGHKNYRVVYTAGYVNIPADVQEACAQWTAALYWQAKDNPFTHGELMPTSEMKRLLAPYRRYPL